MSDLNYLVYQLLLRLDEPLPETALTLVLAYGSFLFAEHVLQVSGVIATATAALVMGNWGEAHAMSTSARQKVFNTLETLAFFLNTFVFLAIGITTPLSLLLDHAWAVILAVVLVLGVRIVLNYPILSVASRLPNRHLPVSYRIVSVWGGLHTTISIALVLGVPKTQVTEPYFDQLRAMVFAVALSGLVIRGLTMPWLLHKLQLGNETGGEFEWIEVPVRPRHAPCSANGW